MTALVGLIVIAAAIWLVRAVAPRTGRPGAAFLKSDALATAFALVLTAWVAGGVALLISGTVDLVWGVGTTAPGQ